VYWVTRPNHSRQTPKVLKKICGGTPWTTVGWSAVDIKDLLFAEGERVGWDEDRALRPDDGLKTPQKQTLSFSRVAILRLAKRLDCSVDEKRVAGTHTGPLQLSN
jgi:hypothetical protein